MKKMLLSLFMSSVILTGCDNATKSKSAEDKEEVVAKPTNKIDSLKLEWTGYKTTEKTPVSGVFKQVKIKGEDLTATTPEEALDGATVKASVTSLFSGNEVRDPKLINIFFGAMENTDALEGVLHLADGKSVLSVTMNSVTKDIPVTTNFSNGAFTVEGDVNITEFGAGTAVEALAKACEVLHTGIDGVSKTWDEAHFKGTVYFSSEFGK